MKSLRACFCEDGSFKSVPLCLEDRKIALECTSLWQEPRPVDVVIKKCSGLLNEGKILETISILEEEKSRHPKNPEILHHLGTSYHQLSRFSEAKSCYLDAIELDPNNSKTYYNLGHLYFDEKEIKESISCFRESLVLNPKDIDSWVSLCVCYRELNMMDECLQACHKALDIDKNSTIALYNLGTSYQELCCHKESLVLFEKVLAIEENHEDAMFNIGLAYYYLSEKEEGSEAKASLENAVKYFRRLSKFSSVNHCEIDAIIELIVCRIESYCNFST